MTPRTRMHAVRLLEVAVLASLSLSFVRAASGHEHMDMHAGHDHAVPAAHDHSAHMATAPSSLVPESVSVKLSGKTLNDQEGRSLRLKDDVIGDRIVVVSFVYTTCTTVCPVVSSIFSDLQNKLGSRLDKDVRLVSLTVDPAHDTPSRLKSYSMNYDAKPGWFWLTGSSANVTEALKGFGAYTPNFENHPVVVMIGDGRTGKWSRHYGLSKSERLLSQVDEYLAARDKTGNSKSAALTGVASQPS